MMMEEKEITEGDNGGTSGTATDSTVAKGGDGTDGYEGRRIRGGGTVGRGGDDGGVHGCMVVIAMVSRHTQHSEARAISLPPAAMTTCGTINSTCCGGSRDPLLELVMHTGESGKGEP